MSRRLAVSLLLLAFLLYVVGAGELLSTLRRIEPLYVFYLLALGVVMIWASCLKWQLFIRNAGHDAQILHLMRLYTIGYFFNSFMPSYVGGDVARSYQLGRELGSQRDAFVSTFLERFTGFLAMAFLGAFFVALGTEATAGVEVAILLVCAGAILLASVCFSEKWGAWWFRVARALLGKISLGKWSKKCTEILDKVQDAMGAVHQNQTLLARAMLLSLFFHFLTVLNTYIAARAIGWESPDLYGLFVVVPLVLLIGMLPLTPSGLGVQEGAFVFFLERVGATGAQGLAVGLVLRAKVMLVAGIGGLLWLQLRRGRAIHECAT